MIHHYINLVCWRSMLELYDANRDVVWIDSQSLYASVSRFRPDAEYRPGTTILPRIGPGTAECGNWFFFTSGPVTHLSRDIHMPLPFFEVISVPHNVASILEALPEGTRVGIGISAPKQNYLAAAMHALRPDLEYHCLGAAINDDYALSIGKRLALSGSGFEWLKFLILYPRRTCRKIVTTVCEIFAISFHRPSRENFGCFVEICMPVTSPGDSNKKKGYKL